MAFEIRLPELKTQKLGYSVYGDGLKTQAA